MYIYCFDLKSKDSAAYNTLKRRFYYHLTKLKKHAFLWNTKSVIAIDDKDEVQFDLFFSKFKDHLILYKTKAANMQKIY